ncbi:MULTISPECIES: HD-GYP domain-containing protein [Bacillus]|uniref:HD-GYP domain-containing protein n=1 Tax=Bacillus TaxID=1386 RepID=UPI0015E14754|nr:MULTISPECIES: HD-GYP domain-containing protein [Bacillus]
MKKTTVMDIDMGGISEQDKPHQTINGSEPLKEPLNTRSEKAAEINLTIDAAAKSMEQILATIRETGTVPIDEIKSSILPVIARAADFPNVYNLLQTDNDNGEYTSRHTICVGILSVLISKWIGLGQADLTSLTIAATLYDIGKAKVPEEILNKPGKLTNDEYQVMKQHTVHGYKLLNDIDQLDRRAALVALQHHEREDGGGYPYGLTGPDIELFAKIVAVADVFHAMSSTRVYQHAEPLYIILEQMQKDTFGKLDAGIMIVFLKKILDNLIGKRVRLNDSSEAEIVMINPYEPLRPLINQDGKLIDLQYNRKIKITKVLKD